MWHFKLFNLRLGMGSFPHNHNHTIVGMDHPHQCFLSTPVRDYPLQSPPSSLAVIRTIIGPTFKLLCGPCFMLLHFRCIFKADLFYRQLSSTSTISLHTCSGSSLAVTSLLHSAIYYSRYQNDRPFPVRPLFHVITFSALTFFNRQLSSAPTSNYFHLAQQTSIL
jgi:hypothetical protein